MHILSIELDADLRIKGTRNWRYSDKEWKRMNSNLGDAWDREGLIDTFFLKNFLQKLLHGFLNKSSWTDF